MLAANSWPAHKRTCIVHRHQPLNDTPAVPDALPSGLRTGNHFRLRAPLTALPSSPSCYTAQAHFMASNWCGWVSCCAGRRWKQIAAHCLRIVVRLPRVGWAVLLWEGSQATTQRAWRRPPMVRGYWRCGRLREGVAGCASPLSDCQLRVQSVRAPCLIGHVQQFTAAWVGSS